MAITPVGSFMLGPNFVDIEGFGHRIDDIKAMSNEDRVKVLASDGRWYKVAKQDILFRLAGGKSLEEYEELK